MINQRHKKEYNEVLALLELIPSYDYLKIPTEKISILRKNSVEGYQVYIDNISDAKISRKAYIIFMKLYKQYIATEEEEKKLDEILLLNDKIKNEKYRIDFNKENKQKKTTQGSLIKVKKNSCFEKIIDKIKNFFKKL